MSEVSETPQPTTRDAILFQVILTNMKNKPEVDWAAVAAKAGYKNASCACTRYGQIIKRLTGMAAGQVHALAGTNAEGELSAASPSPAKKRSGGSGTNKMATKVEKGTPKKRGRKPKAKNEDIKVFEDQGDSHLANRDDYDEEMDETFVVEEHVEDGENLEVQYEVVDA